MTRIVMCGNLNLENVCLTLLASCPKNTPSDDEKRTGTNPTLFQYHTPLPDNALQEKHLLN